MSYRQTNLIINYIPQNLNEKVLMDIFGKFGVVESCKIMKDFKTGYSYGFGFVNYVLADDAQRAVKELNGFEIGNKRIKVSYARPRSDNLKDTNLYITKLPRNTSEQDLEDMFGKFGTIIQKNLLVDKMTGMPRGVAFVRFNTREQAQLAITEMNGKVPDNGTEPLEVRIAEEHGKQKAAYYAGMQAGLRHNRGGMQAGLRHNQRYSQYFDNDMGQNDTFTGRMNSIMGTNRPVVNYYGC